MAGVLALCPYYNRPSQAGIEGHLRAVADATDLPVMIYDIPIRTGRKVSSPLLVKLAREVLEHRWAEGRGRQPGRDGPGHRRGPGQLRGVQRRRRLHAAAPGRRRRRRRRRGHALDRPGPSGAVRAVGQGRHRRRAAGERQAPRELRLRDRRRRAEPAPHQGRAPRARPAGRAVPPADGGGAGLAGAEGPRGPREPRGSPGRAERASSPARRLAGGADAATGACRLPRRARRDRSQLHDDRAGRPHPAHRRRA